MRWRSWCWQGWWAETSRMVVALSFIFAGARGPGWGAVAMMVVGFMGMRSAEDAAVSRARREAERVES